MRINMNIDRYDIDALDQIYSTASNLKDKSEILEKIGITMKDRLRTSSSEFTTVNFYRVSQAVEDYLKKMRLMRDELEELSKSCKDFAEKIAAIWS